MRIVGGTPRAAKKEMVISRFFKLGVFGGIHYAHVQSNTNLLEVLANIIFDGSDLAVPFFDDEVENVLVAIFEFLGYISLVRKIQFHH